MKYCDICLTKRFLPTEILHATRLCYFCEKYFCQECFRDHDGSHEVVTLYGNYNENGSERSTLIDRELNDGLRWEKIKRRKATVDERVDIEYSTDAKKASVTGMCGLGRHLWVVCDGNNKCVKIFKIGSNDLINTIRFGSVISDVQEIDHPYFQTKYMNISNEYMEDDDKCVLAILSPIRKMVILFGVNEFKACEIDQIEIPVGCKRIQFYGSELVLVNSSYVYIMSIYGKILKILSTHRYYTVLDMDANLEVCIAARRIYLLEPLQSVLIINFDGKLIIKQDIEQIRPKDIAVDEEDNVYILSDHQSMPLHKFDCNLQQARPLFGFDKVDMPSPKKLLYHRDKLYISHSNKKTVTVVKLN